MNFLAAYNILGYSNYDIVNVVNVFNFLISVLKVTRPEDHPTIMEDIKIQIGMTFFNKFREYVTRKFPFNHDYVKLVNSQPG